MNPPANKIFHFVRGALRGSYGKEDLENRRVLIIGMDITGQQLLTMFCESGACLFFKDDSLVQYDKAQSSCAGAHPYNNQKIEILIDLRQGLISMKERDFALSLIGQDPYTQGIHAYYL
jgi:hypothetical protein